MWFLESKASSPFPGNTDVDIIELHDLRMSPLPSIRSRSGLVSASGTPGPPKDHDPAKFPPSFRISRAPGYNTHGRNSGLRYRGPRQHKPKVFKKKLFFKINLFTETHTLTTK